MLSLLSLIIGGLLGWLTSAVMRPSARSATVQNIIIGSVSALLSGFLGRGLGFYGPSEMAAFVYSSLGSLIILVIANLLRRREERPPDTRAEVPSPGGRRPESSIGNPPPSAFARVRVFISYRRDNTAGHAGRLYEHLSRHFGQENVFMDIDTIEPGMDFIEAIEQAVGLCDVFLALIGPEWLQSTDARGNRRLDNPTDFVRLEIATALDRNIRVIPVVVDGARMPSTDELPDPLHRLARRNALEISNTRWQYDVDRLIEAIKRSGRRPPDSS